MPEGKEIEFQEGEYPELDGLEPGAQVKFTGAATIEDNGNGMKALRINDMQFEIESPATREFKKMSSQDQSTGSPVDTTSGEDF